MPTWLVRLEGASFDLEDLPSLLHSPEHTVVEEGGLYYLKSSDFGSLDSADKVRECAIPIIEMINGAMKIHAPDHRGARESGVTLIEDNGRRHHYLYIQSSLTVRSKVTANATITASNGTRKAALPHSSVESWIRLAKSDKAVADALHFFTDNTWINLYKVFEIISEDAGGRDAIVRNGWATRRSLGRFTQTAQSKAALGDLARHAADRFGPPSQPMTTQEAESLLRGLIVSWLSSKS